MNLTKCSNGHYYDADKYPSCPHCNKNADNDEKMTVMMSQKDQETLSLERMRGETVQMQPQPEPVMEKKKTVRLAEAMEQKTAPVYQDDDNDKTVSYYGGSMGTEPVVGWLVCISGEMLGKAFELKNGKNFIGRSRAMDIVLEGDPNVSREKHAIVTYEPHGRVFFAQPGESRELFYVDNKVVLVNVEMKDRCVLQIGKTELMFVPLCGSDFSWDDRKQD